MLPLERFAEIRRQRFKLDYGKIRIFVGWGRIRVIVKALADCAPKSGISYY